MIIHLYMNGYLESKNLCGAPFRTGGQRPHSLNYLTPSPGNTMCTKCEERVPLAELAIMELEESEPTMNWECVKCGEVYPAPVNTHHVTSHRKCGCPQ